MLERVASDEQKLPRKYSIAFTTDRSVHPSGTAGIIAAANACSPQRALD